jgi:diacylglycerol kinase (ATP)
MERTPEASASRAAAPPEPLFVVFNPMSGKGRGASLVAPVLSALSDGSPVEHGLTQKPGDERRLTEAALQRGFRSIVAVGGDGTWGNVGDAIVRSGVDACLGLVAGGTGCDLAKSLDVPARNVAAAAHVIKQGHTRRIDVGRVEGRHFLNVVGFGFDIAVIEDSWKVRWLRGDLLYLYCALRQLYAYSGFEVELSIDGGPAARHDLMMLIVANARVFGGGFKIAPRADLADGRLDAMAFDNMPFHRRLALMPRLMRGTHTRAAEVRASVGSRFKLRFDSPPAYETDGEWNRAQSGELLVETLPSALRVLAPPAS